MQDYFSNFHRTIGNNSSARKPKKGNVFPVFKNEKNIGDYYHQLLNFNKIPEQKFNQHIIIYNKGDGEFTVNQASSIKCRFFGWVTRLRDGRNYAEMDSVQGFIRYLVQS